MDLSKKDARIQAEQFAEFLYIGKPTRSTEPGFCSLVGMQKVKGCMRKRGFINVERISDGAKFRAHRSDLIAREVREI